MDKNALIKFEKNKNHIGIVILGAGEGKRLKLPVPKPLAPCIDLKLIDFPIIESKKFLQKHSLQGKINVVVGHGRDQVTSYVQSRYDGGIEFSIQEKQLGTGDALKSFFQNSNNELCDYVVVLCADTPLIREEELSALYSEMKTRDLDGIAATFELDLPFGYGRIVHSSAGKGFRIVEEKDASIDEKNIREVNSGVYIFKTQFVIPLLNNLNNHNKSGEYYLTDIFSEDRKVGVKKFSSPLFFSGVNTLAQLHDVESIMRSRINTSHQNSGVRFISLNETYIDTSVKIEEGVVIYPNVHVRKNSHIKSSSVIHPGCIISDSIIESRSEILPYSVIDSSHVHSEVKVGPFAHLRPGSILKDKSKVGNFVEIKKSTLEKGAKVSHHSYVGDANIGEETNIGCGFITCNYDGVNKHQTNIGKNCFIGSDSQMVAPITLGDECFVAAGSTVTQSAESGSFIISRTKQVTKIGMAKKFLKVDQKKGL